jgi:hypothetical protein
MVDNVGVIPVIEAELHFFEEEAEVVIQKGAAIFIRRKQARKYIYLQIVENRREEGAVRQRFKRHMGGPKIFGKLWEESGCADVVRAHAAQRR